MLSGNKALFRINSFQFQAKHLLVILVLILAFSTAFIIRSYPIKYGFALNEFDPYFDYRATKYIIDNGFAAYLNWHDYESWYPEGRFVPTTSQVALHLIAATLYKIFGFGSSLLDFVIMFPVIIGSLTTIVIFALVRNLSGTTAGMFASLLFAFMPAIIQRGNLGWFKSEPLGLFLALLSVYLFLSSIKSKNIKRTILTAAGGGLILGLANSSWGGIQYFSIPLGIFFFVLPFLRKDSIFLYGIISFTLITLITAGAFPRPGISFVIGLPGIALIAGMIFAIVGTIIRTKSSPAKANRNLIAALAIFVLLIASIFLVGAYQPSSFRYLVAVNPFLSSHNPLVESVAEHSTPTVIDYFTDYSILLIFAGFGVWVSFSKRTDMTVFALIIGLTGLYVSATFARLMVYSSIAIVILASIGLYELTRSILQNRIENENKIKAREFRKNIKEGKILPDVKPLVKIAFVAMVVFLISIPLIDYNGLIYPKNFNWISSADIPPSIVNGATGFRMQVEDWVHAVDWIANNTPKDSVIASWWDYGYWITTLGNKTTLADNATINQTRIETIARMLMSEQETATQIAQDLKADYILVYIVADRHNGPNGNSFYTLGSGGDESKKQWFMKIGGFKESDYVEDDGFTPNANFWNNTLLGKLIPFTPISYASFGNGMLTNIQPEYSSGTIALNLKDIKYPINGTSDQPYKLVYASPSFENDNEDIVFGVFVYQVNKNYKPNPVSQQLNTKDNTTKDKESNTADERPQNMIKANMTSSDNIAILKTSLGNITIEFFPEAAPKHVNNFLNLSKTGFYDGTIFHRIVKDFVIQGGDPTTKNNTQKDRWGTGGPGYTIDAEFNDIPHERGIISMARTGDPNSAGSQFFIVTKDARFLDNQYTVFGRVIDGMEIVDKIEDLTTNQSSDQPIDFEKAKIQKVMIEQRKETK
ncbi:MAG TPA: peptidylprolyl isomerase [Nitrososphaeraceae archaeon]|nr:peptidylprolyl isomerase [Nitrososphaeraceae archaeon]